MVIKIGDLCKKGHVIDGDNAQNYLNRGNPHVRCKTCNTPPVEKKNIGDLCKNGHKIEGDNLLIRRKPKGVKSYACRACGLDAARRYRKSDKYLHNPRYVKNRDHAERIQRQIEAGLYGKAGVSYSDITKREDAIDRRILKDPQGLGIIEALVNIDMNKRSRDAMQTMVSSPGYVEAKCVGKKEQYVDYVVEPKIYEAYEMCAGCPLIVECGRFANSVGPDHGVWGGEVWNKGRIKKYDN